MIEERILVGVVAERRKIDHPWVDHSWSPVAVLSDAPEAPAWTLLASSAELQRYYIGATELVLNSSETAQYRDNLIEGNPRLWVVMREEGPDPPLSLTVVTADPSEGESYTESGASIVATVPMPPELAARVAAFVDEHHVERAFVKRKRDRVKADDFGRRDHTGGGRRGER